MLPLPILLAASGGLYRAQQGEQQARNWVEHTLQVRSDIQEILVRLLDAEASARDFLLTGEPLALRPYRESRELVTPLTEHLALLVADNPPQLRRAADIHELVGREMDGLAALCQNSLKNRMSPAAASGLAVLDGGRDVASRLRGKLTAMQMEEDRLLDVRSHTADAARLHLLTLLVESVILALFFQMVGALLLTSSLSGQIQAIGANARLFGQGLPAKPFVADTREVRDLDDELQQ